MVISFLTYRCCSIVIGILYPSYKTFKSIKYQSFEQYEPLLCYWTLFSFLQISELLFDPFLVLIVPFYFELKLIFLVWLTYRNLSQLLFSRLILIYFNKYEHDIDYLFNNTIHRLTELILRGMLCVLNQQRIESQQKPDDPIRIKTNFASQYRRLHSK